MGIYGEKMNVEYVMSRLKQMARHAKPGYKEGMARYGIKSGNALGVPVPELRKLAKEIGTNHKLALGLWEVDIHEAKLLAPMIDDPHRVKEEQMDSWVRDFDSWDVCDLCCSNLFDKTEFYRKKIDEWTKNDAEFIRRAGFVLIAASAVHDKKASDREFMAYLPLIKKYSTDERNFVKKAVNWALRGIGKRSSRLYGHALRLAEELEDSDDPTARWIGSDAVRELDSKAVKQRIKKKSKH